MAATQQIPRLVGSIALPLPRRASDEDIAASDTYTLKSDSSTTWTLFPSRIPETVCTKNDATSTYGVRLRRSLYGWKDNFITFPTPPDSGPELSGVDGKSRNKSTSRNCIVSGLQPMLRAPPMVAPNPRSLWFFHKLSSRRQLDLCFV